MTTTEYTKTGIHMITADYGIYWRRARTLNRRRQAAAWKVFHAEGSDTMPDYDTAEAAAEAAHIEQKRLDKQRAENRAAEKAAAEAEAKTGTYARTGDRWAVRIPAHAYTAGTQVTVVKRNGTRKTETVGAVIETVGDDVIVEIVRPQRVRKTASDRAWEIGAEYGINGQIWDNA